MTSRSGAFIRGQGGFGGPPQHRPAVVAARPGARPPGGQGDPAGTGAAVPALRRPQPAARGSQVRARGGFSQPILHGLCTYGVTGRALLRVLCDGDPARFAPMSGRFTRPVLPGEPADDLDLARGGGSDTALFQTAPAPTARW